MRWWDVQGATELGDDGFPAEKNKMLREGGTPFKGAELEAVWLLPPREQKEAPKESPSYHLQIRKLSKEKRDNSLDCGAMSSFTGEANLR